MEGPNGLMLNISESKPSNALCVLGLKRGDEVIFCEHGSVGFCSQILEWEVIPVIVKANKFRTCVRDVVRAINGRTKLIVLTQTVGFNEVYLSRRALGALRRVVPKRVSVVFDLTSVVGAKDERFRPKGNELSWNAIAMKTFSKLNGTEMSWTLTSGVKLRFNPFNVGKTTEVEVKWNVQSVSCSLFWNTKMVVLAKSWGFTALGACANFVTLQLSKRLPTWLVRETLKRERLIVHSTAEDKIFNGIKLSLSSMKSNERLIRTLSSIKTTEAVVRTKWNGPRRPFCVSWTKSTVTERRHLRTFTTCATSERF
ncbi:MAG: DegT/DnrJ/EryC1/StrS family aminotransferase [Candidatus Hodgkinia cicadicola]